MVLGNGATEFAALAGDIAKPGIAFGPRPIVHVIEKLAALFVGARRRDGAHDISSFDHLGEQAKARTDEVRRDILDLDRVAQIGLVVTVFQHRFGIGNARKRPLGHRPGRPAAKTGIFLEDTGQNRLDGCKNIVLCYKAHFKIELIKLTRRAIRPCIFITKAWRDLEIAIKARHHQQLLEHLRRLRQRIELPRMDARRHQIIARAFGAARRQDRRLKLGEALIDHAAA